MVKVIPPKKNWPLMFLVIIVVLFSANYANSAAVEELTCNKTRLSKCLTLLQTINNDHNLAFAYTEIELSRMCRTMNLGLECVDDYVSRCFAADRRQYVYGLLKGTEEVIGLLCTPGKFRDEYKRYAPCMKSISLDPKYCSLQYTTLIQSVNPPKRQESSDPIRRQCCAFREYLLCMTETAHYKCGSEASQFIKDYSLKTAGSLIQNQCKNYVSGSLMCHFNSRSTTQVPKMFLIVASVLMPILICIFLIKPTVT